MKILRWLRSNPAVPYLVVCLVWIFLMGVCGACAAAVRPPQVAVASREIAATVYVGSVCGTQVTGASGVLVSSERAFTALHVIRCDRPTIVIRTARGEVRPAALMLFWPDQDLALLRVEAPAPPVKGTGEVSVGQVVCLSPAVPERRRSCGVVTHVQGSTGRIYHTARVLHGNSGSGLYDAGGVLVGVVTHTTPEGGIAIRVPRRIP